MGGWEDGREEREGGEGGEGGRRGRDREGGFQLTSITGLKEALLNGRDETLWNVHAHRLVCELQFG